MEELAVVPKLNKKVPPPTRSLFIGSGPEKTFDFWVALLQERLDYVRNFIIKKSLN